MPEDDIVGKVYPSVWERLDKHTERMMVPGGWLIRSTKTEITMSGVSVALDTVFVMDSGIVLEWGSQMGQSMTIADLIRRLEEIREKEGNMQVRVTTLSHYFLPEPVVRPAKDGSGQKWLILND